MTQSRKSETPQQDLGQGHHGCPRGPTWSWRGEGDTQNRAAGKAERMLARGSLSRQHRLATEGAPLVPGSQLAASREPQYQGVDESLPRVQSERRMKGAGEHRASPPYAHGGHPPIAHPALCSLSRLVARVKGPVFARKVSTRMASCLAGGTQGPAFLQACPVQLVTQGSGEERFPVSALQERLSCTPSIPGIPRLHGVLRPPPLYHVAACCHGFPMF